MNKQIRRVSEIEQDPGVELHNVVLPYQNLYEMCDNLRICGIDADIFAEGYPPGYTPIARARLYDSNSNYDAGYDYSHIFFLCVREKE